jgi:hypothetical protein
LNLGFDLDIFVRSASIRDNVSMSEEMSGVMIVCRPRFVDGDGVMFEWRVSVIIIWLKFRLMAMFLSLASLV